MRTVTLSHTEELQNAANIYRNRFDEAESDVDAAVETILQAVCKLLERETENAFDVKDRQLLEDDTESGFVIYYDLAAVNETFGGYVISLG